VIVAVTGANGFLGRVVCRQLLEAGHEVRTLTRPGSQPPAGTSPTSWSGVDDEAAICRAVAGCDSVIHLAALVHQGRATDQQPARYLAINAAGARRLAELCAESGVRELLFASSVKAVGEANTAPWTEETPPAPVDAYGMSKLEAERGLAAVTAECGIATAALRLPLLYGPEVRANMLRLFAHVDRGTPLPLNGIRNRRSLLYVGNAAAAFTRMVGGARGHEVYFVSDGEDVSTPELIRRIAAALGRRPRLLPAPERALTTVARWSVPGISPVARRLVSSLTVDASRFRARVGPLPWTMEQGLQETARWYRAGAAA
jgi:nucleoside-diphosphate-sugar epimerase